MATLVHDDVLDRAQLRRGRPTVFARGGAAAATATGDLLFSRAFAELTLTRSEEAVRVLSWASSALARGELMQREDAWSDDVPPERYLERCELKTARLFEAACRLGAILGRPGAEAAAALGEFGSRIGVAFQIFDDVLDVSGPTERTGKLRGTDLLDGTVTLPLILARKRDPALRKLEVKDAAGGGSGVRPDRRHGSAERSPRRGAQARRRREGRAGRAGPERPPEADARAGRGRRGGEVQLAAKSRPAGCRRPRAPSRTGRSPRPGWRSSGACSRA